MLKKIFIQNYKLIDKLELEFHKRLNVITGETGSGKSILISAIDVVLGGKASKESIKTGCDRAYIELTLVLKSSIDDILNEYGIESFGEELVVSKEITISGSRSRVNGTLVNQDFIKILREKFLDIHSQHQTYSFMQPKYHITLLDSYAKSDCGDLFEEYSAMYSEYKEVERELNDAEKSNELSESQIDFLKFQVEEIESAQVEDIEEDEKLEQELAVLENAEKLKELTGGIAWTISNDDESILNTLSQLKMNLAKAVRLDSSLESSEGELVGLIEGLKELSYGLRDYSQSLNNDTERLNSIQERLFLLDKLKRKYGSGSCEKPLENVLNTYDKLQNELQAALNYENNLEELKQRYDNLFVKLTKLAVQITEKRKIYAESLSALIVNKLENLELPKVQFKISVEPTSLNKNGTDNVEFLISTNISEPVRPLAKIASGGEISRVMLALKSIFAEHDDIDTVIFDEIDTGISGKASQKVADEISLLGDYRQILIITHQAIIASKADEHIYIKKTQDDITTVTANILGKTERLSALAELASGDISEQSIEFAKTLIKQ